MFKTLVNKFDKRIFYTLAVLSVTAAALLFAATFNTADAQGKSDAGSSRSRIAAPAVTFPANPGTLGPIPDNLPATPRDVTFTVSGLTGTLSNVEVSHTYGGPIHSWVGDLNVTLIAPNAASHLLYGRTGQTGASAGDSSDLSGPYNHKDSAAGTNWWAAAFAAGAATVVPPGDYRTTAGGPQPVTNTSPVTNLTAAFASVPNPNGTWTLRFTDNAAGDTGAVSAASLTLTTASAVNRKPFDFDADGKDDVSVYRNGIWYLLRSTAGFAAVNWGLPTDKTVAGDYDGDGKTDTAVFRSGAWIILSANGTVSIVNWGLAGDIPMVGDYDGDSRTDFTVFRNGVWYILQSSNGGFVAASFGLPTDKPVVGKFDADNKSDIAVFRNGNWYILGSLTGFSAIGFGTTGDVPVPGDYDGDGRTDVAVFRGGNWYVLRSTAGFSAVGWGLGTDTAVPADYDGDNKTDVAVFRNGNWYILQSSNGAFLPVGFGLTGDKPIPAQLQ